MSERDQVKPAVRHVDGGAESVGRGDVVAGEKPKFRSDIQGLRAIAVALVVIFHSGAGFSGGFLGVDVFFVISGYVIGRQLLHEQASSGRIALGAFYARRVRRLLPALAAVLVFVAAVSIVGLSPLGSIRDTTKQVGIGASLYGANIALLIYQKVGYFDLSSINNPLLHTWTLAVEEQFYVLFPLLLLLVARLTKRRVAARARRVLLVAIVGVSAVSFVAGVILSGAVGDVANTFSAAPRIAFYSSPTRAWEFLLGVLIVFLEPAMTRLSARASQLLGFAGLVAVLAAGLVLHESTPDPGFTTLIPVVGTMLVILGGTFLTSVLQRGLSSRPLVWIGDRSYGWYLWHWPLIVFVRTSFPLVQARVLLLVGVAALIPTELSYRFLEQRVRSNQRWVGWRAVRLGATCSLIGIGAFVAMSRVPTDMSPGSRAAAESLGLHGEAPTGCLFGVRADDPKVEIHCSWTVPHPKGKIVMVGDSHTGALANAVGAQANKAGYTLSVAWRTGCPFADVLRVYPEPSLTNECRAFVQRTMKIITLTRPNLVILASRQDSYVHLSQFALADPSSKKASSVEAQKALIWRQGLTRTLAQFAAAKIPTVVVSTIPQIPPFNINLCAAWRLWTEPSSCARTLPRSTIDAYRRAGLVASTEAVATAPDWAHLVDFTDDICSASTCSTYRNGDWWYSDSAHLSPLGSQLLEPEITRKILPFVGRNQ